MRGLILFAIFTGALGWASVVSADVQGTSSAEVVVYGRVFHYAVPEGGGWAAVYDGDGGCVFAYDSGNSPTYRGSFSYRDYDAPTSPWYVYGGSGADHIYSPNLYDSDSLVCSWVSYPSYPNYRVDTDGNHREAYIYGDSNSTSIGDADTIYSCPSWHCHAYGDGGDDTITGGTANDLLRGRNGTDILNGGNGADELYGDAGDDTVNAGGNNDIYVYGDIGNDTLNGGTGNDTLYGEDGTDSLNGESGNDTLYGGNDNDTLTAGIELGDSDVCYGGGGTDTCSTGSPSYCNTEDCENP